MIPEGAVDPPEVLLCHAFPPAKVRAGGCIAIRTDGARMQQSDVAIDPRDSNLMQGDYLQVEAQARCMLKATTSSGFAWPQRATFDCQDRLSSLLHKAKSAFVHYATPKGMVE